MKSWNRCYQIAEAGEFLEGTGFLMSSLGYYHGYINKIGKEPKESVWYDPDNRVCFGSEQIFACSPADFSFFETKERFLSDPQWGVESIKKAYPELSKNIKCTEEYIISADDRFHSTSKSEVLIIGGGPSTLDVDWNTKGKQVWTCNNFHQSEKLKNTKIDVAVIGPTVDTSDPEFLKRVKRDGTLCLIDGGVTPHRNGDQMPPNPALYHTRYFSKLGMTPRLIALAAHLGAKGISVVGFDGYPNGHAHAFEAGKNIDNKYNASIASLYNRQIILFWEYITSITDVNIRNLGEDHPANQSTEITKQLFRN